MAGGRPPADLPVDAEGQVSLAAFVGSPDREIAAMLGIAISTLKRRFGPILVKQRAMRRVMLRNYQMKAAQKGNPAMLIWLGKQELDQREVYEFAPRDLENRSDEELEAIASGKVARLRVLKGSASSG